MAVNNLAAPTSVGQVIEENGVRFISFDGVSWNLYVINEDNIVPAVTGAVTDAQRAQLIYSRGIPSGFGSVATGSWLSVVEGPDTAYRLILSATGMSVYSLTEPV